MSRGRLMMRGLGDQVRPKGRIKGPGQGRGDHLVEEGQAPELMAVAGGIQRMGAGTEQQVPG